MRLRIEIDDTDISQQLRDIADFIDASFLNEEDAIPFIAWCKYQGCDFEDKWRREFNNTYEGHHPNKSCFAEHLYANTVGKPESMIQDYIDWEKFRLKLFEDDYYKIDADDGIYVFRRT